MTKKTIKNELITSPLRFIIGSVMMGQALVSYADVPPLSVEGNKVIVGEQSISLGGMSYFWSNNGWGGERFYTPGSVAFLKSDWNASIVRAAMGVEDSGGYFDDPVRMTEKVRTIVNAAIENDLYVIIDWHSHHAHEHDWSHAINFFRQMAMDFGQYNNVIYEIYNEPLQVSWSSSIKPYAEAVIEAIREVDKDNLIVVGTPTWSQDVDVASQDPINGVNIAYTLHFYAGTHGQSLRNKATIAMNNGIALFVTEWGAVNANGDGGVAANETDAWMSFLKKHDIHHANWSLNDKSEGASALNPGASTAGGWSDNDLTASGQLIRGYLRDWPQIPGDNGSESSSPSCTTTALPATIEAEAYCTEQGVEVESSSDTGGGSSIGWIHEGDWTTYSIDVPASGTYEVLYRIASLNGGGVLELETDDGTESYGQLSVPQTGGWQNWVTISHQVKLNSGSQDIRIESIHGGWNLNWIELKSADSGSSSGGESNNCTGVNEYPNWTTKDWSGGPTTHNEAGDPMVYQDKLYVANWYTNSIPGSDGSWTYQGACQSL